MMKKLLCSIMAVFALSAAAFAAEPPVLRVSYGIGRQLGDQLRDNPPPGASLEAGSFAAVLYPLAACAI